MQIELIDYNQLGLAQRLEAICGAIEAKIVFTTSLGLEDQLITHHIASNHLPIEIITLDTGRLFDESHKLWQETEDKYGITIKGYYPNQEAIAKWVRINGTNGFRNSIDARKACCGIRKIEPLDRALNGAGAWITGLRADQSDARNKIGAYEFDNVRGLHKLNPLFDYTRERILQEVNDLGVPYNSLHDQGFLSIGCAPCTRAVKVGELERAGRWWWENQEENEKECGLHIDANGRLVRQQEASR